MTLRSLHCAGLLFAVCSTAHGQDPPADPVLLHYREYRAALERGDAAAAETSAQAAYDASLAANGPRTGVLALNLANLRLDLGKLTEAYAPAQKAHEIATADASSGVDPLLASLTLGRAALSVDGMQAAAALREALTQAERRGEFQTEAYTAAVDLARAAFTNEQYRAARDGWAMSGQFAAAAPSDIEFARGLARTGEGAAVFMQALVDAPGAQNDRAEVANRDARAANDALVDALELLQRYTEGADPSVLTLAQGVYAQALAWHTVVRAKMRMQGDELRGFEPPRSAAGERCEIRIVTEPPLAPMSEALALAGVGTVVFRVATDAEGRIVDRQVAAAVPGGMFTAAVAAVADEWRVEVAPDASCRAGTQYPQLTFVAE